MTKPALSPDGPVGNSASSTKPSHDHNMSTPPRISNPQPPSTPREHGSPAPAPVIHPVPNYKGPVKS